VQDPPWGGELSGRAPVAPRSVTSLSHSTAHKLRSAEKFQGASGAACSNDRKVINANGEFVIGLKRTSELRETYFLQMVHHTHFCTQIAHIVRQLQCDFCDFELLPTRPHNSIFFMIHLVELQPRCRGFNLDTTEL
jgi:hypothetical protein